MKRFEKSDLKIKDSEEKPDSRRQWRYENWLGGRRAEEKVVLAGGGGVEGTNSRVGTMGMI